MYDKPNEHNEKDMSFKCAMLDILLWLKRCAQQESPTICI